MLGVHIGTVGSHLNRRLGVGRNESKNKPGGSKLSLFSTNISKRTKDWFSLEFSNSICKRRMNKKNHGTEMAWQRLVSCREASAFGNAVNSQLPKITCVHL
jgi:hypothetical protein